MSTSPIGRPAQTPGHGRPFMLSVSAMLLSVGMVLAINPRHPFVAAVFSLSLAASLIAIFLPSFGPLKHAKARHVVGLLAATLLAQLVLLSQVPPGYFLELDSPMAGLPYVGGLVAAGLLATAIIVRGVAKARHPLFLGLLSVYVLMGAWLINVSPDPFIDVHVFQEQGSETLLRGENPYSITTYPDIYGEGSGLYSPGLVEDGHLTFGFSYPPLSLLLALPAHVLGGDYRYAQLFAMVLAALLIATIKPGRAPVMAALVFLFTPRSFYVLEQGWTEPYAAALLALVATLAVRRSRLLPIAVGLAAAVKQHMVPLLPLAVVLLNGGMRSAGRWRLAVRSTAVAIAVSLPMMLWNLPDFINSTLILHLRQPFRPDSLSYLAWFGSGADPWLPTWVAFPLFLGGAALVALRLGRSAAAFATTTTVAYFVFFLFSKQAFVHYYYFVLAALCITVVVWLPSIVPEDSS